jgi:uncharacterized SAM-binding protein YcdF (DUF218 family)
MTYTQPLILLFGMIALFGLVRLRNCKGILVPTVGLLGLLLISWPPIDWLLSRPLEARYPIQPAQPAGGQAIVVLASGIAPPQPERPYPLPDETTFRRCEFAAWIHTHRLPVPVLACGGAGVDGDEPYSLSMRQLLQREGVPGSMTWTEERSRNTHENAVFGSEILKRNGITSIVLVVEAASMARAAACFRKAGMTVTPAPSEFREFGPWSEELIPSWKAIRRNELTLHEMAGYAWYRLRGWI